MAGFSDTAENAILALIFNATTWTNIAVNATSSPLTSLYLALHTADPGDAGTQATSEAAYTSYARQAVARTTSGFTAPSGGATNLASAISFPTGTGGSGTLTNFSVGVAVSGATAIIMSGAISPSIVSGNGVQPQLTTATTFTLD
jgi:hypothetical protein